MGDAAGELAERGELLRLVELALDLALRGDVAHDRDEPVEAALAVAQPGQRHRQRQRPRPALGPADLERLALGALAQLATAGAVLALG